eukprot:scaffold4847_cov130-Isochrysis_galbana.AAC.2
MSVAASVRSGARGAAISDFSGTALSHSSSFMVFHLNSLPLPDPHMLPLALALALSMIPLAFAILSLALLRKSFATCVQAQHII